MNKGIVFAANRNKVRGTLSRCLLGIVSLGALTFICFGLHLSIAAVGFLYLIVVGLLSLTGDAISSIVSSIVAAVCLNWFFAPPIFSFRVNDPLDIAALIAFLTTAAVISRLVSDMRRMSIESLSSVNRKLVDAEERERNRIARDLHHDVGQKTRY